MGVAHVSVYVREDAPLVTRLLVSVAGGPRAWVYVDEGLDVALWGSPAALRRLAAALVVAAEEADALIAPREWAARSRGRSVDAHSGDELVGRVVAGS
jgi:hypothetical protein